MFNLGLRLVIDGTDSEYIRRILQTRLEREIDPVLKNLAQAKKAAVASIYSGDNPRVLFAILCAYFDESITRELEKYFEEL
jgi:flagellar motor component MotA